ncbi:hypothetical protein JTB14_038093 [Gonioctena quinquepunctata]|nr:hypothetical protein JTB14_038093 [Gonioctena quinquepunctata]
MNIVTFGVLGPLVVTPVKVCAFFLHLQLQIVMENFKLLLLNQKENWYGTAAPYLDFFVGNGLRLNELRLGHKTMPKMKEGDKSKVLPVNNEASQIIFHCIFGTYKEDLTILEQITDLGTWNTREYIGNEFKGMRTGGNSVNTKPPQLKYYSKLTAANQTGLLATTYQQVSSVPVFSGKRTQNYKEDFFEQLGRKTGTVSSVKTIPQITATLTEILPDLRK